MEQFYWKRYDPPYGASICIGACNEGFYDKLELLRSQNGVLNRTFEPAGKPEGMADIDALFFIGDKNLIYSEKNTSQVAQAGLLVSLYLNNSSDLEINDLSHNECAVFIGSKT